jgi:RNA polymerase sigma factor (sigma-70 family)
MRLQQVFWNLLKNASKFSPVGSSIRVSTGDLPDFVVVTVSDSSGTVIDEDGFTPAKLAELMEVKNHLYGRVSDYAQRTKTNFHAGVTPWGVKVDVALPCATQNELNEDDARTLVKNGVLCVAEGANMPSTLGAIQVFEQARVLYAPGKASNAGGVATSGLEMSQNAMRLSWPRDEVDARLLNPLFPDHGRTLTRPPVQGQFNCGDGVTRSPQFGQYSHTSSTQLKLLHLFQTTPATLRVLPQTMPSPDLERLYDEHASAVFAFLLNFTRHEADTRDLLQELFIKLARQPELLHGVRDPRSFLLRLSHNGAIDIMRRRGTREKKHEQLGAETAGAFVPSADPDEQAFRQALAEALQDLPPEQRAVVHLKLWEGLTFEAIAEALDLPANTAASRYRYGLDKLRERLRPLYEEIK